MSISNLFYTLGAPLANVRWSWGGIRERDRVVVLRVWQENDMKHEGKWWVRILKGDAIDSGAQGYLERMRHIELIKSGYKSMLVMCVSKDETVIPREIKSFNDKHVFIGGSIVELGGDLYIERLDRIEVAKAV